MEGLLDSVVIGVDGEETLCHFENKEECLGYILSLSYEYDVIIDKGTIILSDKS